MATRVAAAILLAIGVSACERWSDARVAESKQRGDIVCEAVKAYRAKIGKYPFQLSDLQPDFLQEIPQPTAGAKQWGYTVVDDGADYWLYVVGSEWGPILDRKSDGKWGYMKGASR